MTADLIIHEVQMRAGKGVIRANPAIGTRVKPAATVGMRQSSDFQIIRLIYDRYLIYDRTGCDILEK